MSAEGNMSLEWHYLLAVSLGDSRTVIRIMPEALLCSLAKWYLCTSFLTEYSIYEM